MKTNIAPSEPDPHQIIKDSIHGVHQYPKHTLES